MLQCRQVCGCHVAYHILNECMPLRISLLTVAFAKKNLLNICNKILIIYKFSPTISKTAFTYFTLKVVALRVFQFVNSKTLQITFISSILGELYDYCVFSSLYLLIQCNTAFSSLIRNVATADHVNTVSE